MSFPTKTIVRPVRIHETQAHLQAAHGNPRRPSLRVLHALTAAALVIFVSWGLLATNPLQSVN